MLLPPWCCGGRKKMQGWASLKNVMRSYHSYFLLVLVLYTFLIFIFHTQLTMYDAKLRAAGLNKEGGLVRFSATAFHVRDLRLDNESLSDDKKHMVPVHSAGVLKKPVRPSAKGQRQDNLERDRRKPLELKDNSREFFHHVPQIYSRKHGFQNNINYSSHFYQDFHDFEQDLRDSGDKDLQQGLHAIPEQCRQGSGTKSNYFDSVPFQSILANYIYTAFYDERGPGGPFVRIITLLKKSEKPALYCHFDTANATNQTHSTAMAAYYEMCENHAKDYGGWILSCEVPSHLTESPCNVTVSLHSRYNPRLMGNINVPVLLLQNPAIKKLDFGICVPPLFGYIPSTTLIEFVELTRILGAQHLIFYAHEIPREIHKVLRYYKSLGVATVIPWGLPVPDKAIWYHGQLLAINDCLYRNMHRFKYLAFNDIDEFIVPHTSTNWTGMTQQIVRESLGNPKRHAGYSFQSAFFDPLLDTSSRVLYDLESDLRTKAFSKVRTKVMVEAERIFELGIHHISRPLFDYRPHYVEPNVAFLHHYRKCVTDFDPRMNCQIFARDESVSRYIPTLRHNVHRTLWILKEAEKHSNQDHYIKARSLS